MEKSTHLISECVFQAQLPHEQRSLHSFHQPLLLTRALSRENKTKAFLRVSLFQLARIIVLVIAVCCAAANWVGLPLARWTGPFRPFFVCQQHHHPSKQISCIQRCGLAFIQLSMIGHSRTLVSINWDPIAPTSRRAVGLVLGLPPAMMRTLTVNEVCSLLTSFLPTAISLPDDVNCQTSDKAPELPCVAGKNNPRCRHIHGCCCSPSSSWWSFPFLSIGAS